MENKVWYCDECGQDSSIESTECEICGAPRAAAGVETLAEVTKSEHRETFELDGEQVRYAPKPEPGDGRVARNWAEIVRSKKEQGL